MSESLGNVNQISLPAAATPTQDVGVAEATRNLVVDPSFTRDRFLNDTSETSVKCASRTQIPNSIVRAFSKVPDVDAALAELVKIAPREYSMRGAWSMGWRFPFVLHDTPSDWSALKSVAVSDKTANQLRLILDDPQGDKLRISPSGGCSWFIHRDIETLSQASAVLFTAATAMRSATDGMWYIDPMTEQCFPVESDACSVSKMQREIGDLADAVNVVKLSVEAEDREYRSHLLTILVFGGGALTGLFFGVRELIKYFSDRNNKGGGTGGVTSPSVPEGAPAVKTEHGDGTAMEAARPSALGLFARDAWKAAEWFSDGMVATVAYDIDVVQRTANDMAKPLMIGGAVAVGLVAVAWRARVMGTFDFTPLQQAVSLVR